MKGRNAARIHPASQGVPNLTSKYRAAKCTKNQRISQLLALFETDIAGGRTSGSISLCTMVDVYTSSAVSVQQFIDRIRDSMLKRRFRVFQNGVAYERRITDQFESCLHSFFFPPVSVKIPTATPTR